MAAQRPGGARACLLNINSGPAGRCMQIADIAVEIASKYKHNVMTAIEWTQWICNLFENWNSHYKQINQLSIAFFQLP